MECCRQFAEDIDSEKSLVDKIVLIEFSVGSFFSNSLTVFIASPGIDWVREMTLSFVISLLYYSRCVCLVVLLSVDLFCCPPIGQQLIFLGDLPRVSRCARPCVCVFVCARAAATFLVRSVE